MNGEQRLIMRIEEKLKKLKSIYDASTIGRLYKQNTAIRIDELESILTEHRKDTEEETLEGQFDY